MVSCADLKSRKEKLSLIGLGYVGLPIAVAFSKHVNVIGFDLNPQKIDRFRSGIDPTKEVGDEAVRACSVEFTCDETKLGDCKFHIVAVPTPINPDKTPDLSLVKSACEILGRNLRPGSIVVFESTVYPGVTEDICVPILERISGLSCGDGFAVGYSPERINPGDKVHRLETIVKVVSGMNKQTLETVAEVYELVVQTGVYKASGIKVAEAAKVIENSQRDINIAFMNELSMIFNKMGIDTLDVLKAAGTKWNFLNFRPGLVGGHCIGIDPYYLTYKAEQLGYLSQIILAGRRINDSMGKYVAETLVKHMIKSGIQIKGARVGVLGFTFKEGCPDVRNTRVIDIINELNEYGVECIVADPEADWDEAESLYGIKLHGIETVNGIDCLVIAVAHRKFKDMSSGMLEAMFRLSSGKKIVADLKGAFSRDDFPESRFLYWRL